MAKAIRTKALREFFITFKTGEEKVIGTQSLTIPERSRYWKELNEIRDKDENIRSIGWRNA